MKRCETVKSTHENSDCVVNGVGSGELDEREANNDYEQVSVRANCGNESRDVLGPPLYDL